MKLLFKQRLFSWLDSYDIYDEAGQTVYTVKGEIAFGHQLRIYDANGFDVGCVKQKVFSWLPCFEVYEGQTLIGTIKKELTLFSPKYNIDFKGWQVNGDWGEWEYLISDSMGATVAEITKKIWNFTDTYELDIVSNENALYVLMLVLAIDAEKCSRD